MLSLGTKRRLPQTYCSIYHFVTCASYPKSCQYFSELDFYFVYWVSEDENEKEYENREWKFVGRHFTINHLNKTKRFIAIKKSWEKWILERYWFIVFLF